LCLHGKDFRRDVNLLRERDVFRTRLELAHEVSLQRKYMPSLGPDFWIVTA